MMPRFTYLMLALLLAGQSFAQQLPVYSSFNINNYLLNPAVAGTESYIDFTLQHRMQWVGFDHKPSTQIFSAHSRLDQRASAFGGYFYNDRSGVLGNLGFSGSYAYHLQLND